MHFLARATSAIFDPIIISTLTLFLIIYQTEKDIVSVFKWFVFIIIVGVLPPLIFLAYEKKRGRVTDWFLYNRKERVPIYVATLISLSTTLLLIWRLEGPPNLLFLSLVSFLNTFFLALATYLGHKPSVHASATTYFVLILVLLFNPQLWPIILLIPLVAWSRWHLKKHTPSQILAGIFITLVVVVLTFKFFAFI